MSVFRTLCLYVIVNGIRTVRSIVGLLALFRMQRMKLAPFLCSSLSFPFGLLQGFNPGERKSACTPRGLQVLRSGTRNICSPTAQSWSTHQVPEAALSGPPCLDPCCALAISWANPHQRAVWRQAINVINCSHWPGPCPWMPRRDSCWLSRVCEVEKQDMALWSRRPHVERRAL